MQRRSALFNLFLLISDIVFINISFIIGNYLKGGFILSPYIVIAQNSKLLLFATFTIIAIFSFFKLYEINSKRSEVDEAGAAIAALTVGMFFFEFMTIFYRDLIFKRMTILYAWAISIVLIVTFRVGSIIVRKWLYSLGMGISNILVIGKGDTAHLLLQKVLKHPEMGLRVAGFLRIDEGQDVKEKLPLEIGTLKSALELKPILQEKKINKVIFAVPDAPTHQIMEFIEVCEIQNIEFMFAPRVLDIIESRISSDEVIGIPLITVREIKLYGFNAFLKRASDLIFSSILIVLLSPLLLLIAVLIKTSSPGRVLFVQKRVGERAIEFDMYKFRSMIEGAEEVLDEIADRNEAEGLIFKIRDDPRITWIGRFLRKWSLDELPQIFNVLKGEMSLVGPRPPLPREVEKYNSWHRKRLNVAPGITGIWQVSGRSELSFEQMVKLDLFYIESWSLWLDIKILLKTIPVVLFTKGAY